MAGVGGYENVVASSRTIQVGGIAVTVAAVELIKRSKEYLNRPKDQDHLTAISQWEQAQVLPQRTKYKGKPGLWSNETIAFMENCIYDRKR